MNKRVVAAVTAIVLAIAGVVVLLNYASGANARAFNGAKLVSVLEVTQPIAANTKSTDVAANVRTVKLPSSAIVKGAIKDLAEVAGLSTTTSLEPGEQVLQSRFADAAKQSPITSKSAVPVGRQEVTISLDSARAMGGTLNLGDLVGVVASYQTTGGDGVTKLILNRVPITRIGNGGVAQDAQTGGGTQLITVAVMTRDAGKIINALEFGKVWLTKQNAATAPGNGGSISRNDVTR